MVSNLARKSEEVGFAVPVLQMRRLRPREVKGLVQGHKRHS